MDDVVAPLLHNKDPVNDPAVKTELPQLFTTVTTGDEGIAFTVNVAGSEFTDPPLLVHTARYCLLLSAIVVANVNMPSVAPLILFQLVPFVLCCQCTVGAGFPFAAEAKLTMDPAHFDCGDGCKVTIGNEVSSFILNTTSTQ